MFDRVTRRCSARAAVLAAVLAGLGVLAPSGAAVAQTGTDVRLGVDGVPLRECDRADPGCMGHRTEFVVLPSDVPRGTLEPYFPQELMTSVYRRLGVPQDPLTCSALGDGFDLSRTDVLVAQFVSFREAIGSGLHQAEFDFFLADERNYLLWFPAQYAARNDRDPAGWLPPRNGCWYLRHYLSVKERWSLAVDWAERDAIQDLLDVCGWQNFDANCETDLVRARVVPETLPAPVSETAQWVRRCNSDSDTRISCAEAAACGAPLPVVLGDALYPVVVDADNDGVACR